MALFGGGTLSLGSMVVSMSLKGDKFISDMRTAKGELTGMGKKITDNAQTFRVLGIAAAAAGAAIVGGLGIAAKAAIDFEARARNAQSILIASGVTYEQVAALAREWGQTTVFNAEESANAIYKLASAGLKWQDIQSAGNEIIKFAVAENYAFDESAELITNTIKGLGLSFDDTGKVANVFSAAISGSNMTAGRLKDALTYALPAAKSFGMSIEEMSAFLMLFHDNAAMASIGGSRLVQAMLALTNVSKAGAARLSEFGLTVKDIDPSLYSMNEIMKILVDTGMKGSDAFKIWGRRGGQALSLLIEAFRENSAAIDENMNKVSQSGVLHEKYNEQMKSLANQLKLLWSALTELKIELGTQLMPTLTTVVQTVTGAIRAFTDWSKEHHTLTKVVLLTTGAFGLLLASIGPILIMLPGAVTAFSLLAPAISGVTAAIGTAAAGATLVGALTTLGFVLGGLAIGGTVIWGIYEGVKAWKEWERAHKAAAEAVRAENEYMKTVGIKSMEDHTSAVMEQTKKRIEALHEEAEKIRASADMNVEAKNAELTKLNTLIEGHIQRVLASAKNRGEDTLAIEEEFADAKIALLETANKTIHDDEELANAKLREVQRVARLTQLADMIHALELERDQVIQHIDDMGAVTNQAQRNQLHSLRIHLQSIAKSLNMGYAKQALLLSDSTEMQCREWERSQIEELTGLRSHETRLLLELRKWMYEKEALTKTEMKKMLDFKGKITAVELEQIESARQQKIASLEEELEGVRKRIRVNYGDLIAEQKLKDEMSLGLTQEFQLQQLAGANASQQEVLRIATEERKKLKDVLEKANKDLLEKFVYWGKFALEQKETILKEFGDFGDELVKKIEPGWLGLLSTTENILGQITSLVNTNINSMVDALNKLKEALDDAVGESWFIDRMKSMAQYSQLGFGGMAAAATSGSGAAIGALGNLQRSTGGGSYGSGGAAPITIHFHGFFNERETTDKIIHTVELALCNQMKRRG